ncbi:MAG: CoA-binding protein [Bacteroidota bacterium]
MDNKPTLIVGASTKRHRYSNEAVHRLVAQNQPVYAFGRREGDIAGIPIWTKEEEVQIPDLHTISLYIGPAHQPPMYDWLISLAPKRVIFNPGTENPALYQKLTEAGIEANMACTLVMLSTAQY